MEQKMFLLPKPGIKHWEIAWPVDAPRVREGYAHWSFFTDKINMYDMGGRRQLDTHSYATKDMNNYVNGIYITYIVCLLLYLLYDIIQF